MGALNVAAYHHLPTGGALRVLAEWVRHTSADVTVYTPDPSVHEFAGFPPGVRVRHVEEADPANGLAGAKGLLRSVSGNRRAARAIDAAGHDAVFVLPSILTQSPTLLMHLRTPSVYYAPEAMRSAYDDPHLMFPGDSWQNRLTRAGLNPVEQLRRRLDRRAARAATCVVTHSEFTRQDLRRAYGVDAQVVRLGVDVDAFRPVGKGDDSEQSYALSVGALHPLKGHDFVLDAIARIPRRSRPRLVVVGDRGDTGTTLERQARELGVALDLRRSIPFPEVVSLAQGATVVACAQIREPFGLVPLEAMACARPVIAVAEGGLRESVRDGETGLLVPRDPQAMADAIARLLGDAALRERLGQAGRVDVEARWRWDQFAATVDELLSARAVAERSSRSRVP